MRDEATTITADEIARIARGEGDDGPGRVDLHGAVVLGQLDLAHADVDVPLTFEDCRFEEPVVLTGARLRSLSLSGCELPALWADELETAHTLRFERCTVAAGPVRLSRATVGGELVLTGTRLAGADERGFAFVADRLRTGEVWCDGGFEASGALVLRGAVIDGNLVMDGAKLLDTDPSGCAFVGDGLRVGGGARLRDGFEAAGAVRFWGADIGAQLNLRAAQLTGVDVNGDALVAEQAHVGANVFLNQGFDAAGTVRVRGARIDGNLELSDARLAGTDAYGNALAANGLHVQGNLYIRDSCQVGGEIRLVGAVVDGHVALSGARDVRRVQLEGARFGSLRHDRDSWPPPGELRLRGFRFDDLVGETGWRPQLEWVRRQGFTRWSSDPYEQLAGYYARIGDESAARRVRIARHDDELTHLRQVRRRASIAYRFWRRMFGWLVGYGYRRWPAGALLVLTLLAAGAFFKVADDEGAMVPSDSGQIPPAGASADRPPRCGDDHPCFNAAVYGADVVLPVVDFGQDSAWRPSERTAWGRRAAAARWGFIAVGWLLASVFVAAFTRLVQRD